MVLGVAVTLAIFTLPRQFVVWFPALFVVVGLHEFGTMAKVKSKGWKFVYVAFGSLLGAVGLAMEFFNMAETLLMASVVFWLLAITTVILFPTSRVFLERTGVVIFVGLAIMLGGWLGFVVILEQEQGVWLLFWILSVTAMADIGGYFFGRRFGHHKLLPRVSPGKTWEGVLGGYSLTLLGGYGLAIMTPVGERLGNGFGCLIVISLLFVLSIFGDLFESALKRSADVKDSGSTLPGHGGLLDRIDSAVICLPLFAVILVSYLV